MKIEAMQLRTGESPGASATQGGYAETKEHPGHA